MLWSSKFIMMLPTVFTPILLLNILLIAINCVTSKYSTFSLYIPIWIALGPQTRFRIPRTCSYEILHFFSLRTLMGVAHSVSIFLFFFTIRSLILFNMKYHPFKKVQFSFGKGEVRGILKIPDFTNQGLHKSYCFSDQKNRLSRHIFSFFKKIGL